MMNKFIAVFVLLFIPWAFAQTNPDDLAPLVDLRNGGQAVGKANDGSLLGASLLAKEGEGYVRSSSDATSWGAGSMISLLENSSALYMQTYNPSVKIYIGDISLQTGGKYSPHSSHQNGLDVDVLYMGNKRYDSVFDKDGNLTDRYNYQANWDYWRIVVSQQILKNDKPVSIVSMILVDPKLKELIDIWAQAQNFTDPLDAEILKLLRPTVAHDDHFHLRLRCSPYHPQCL